MPVERQVVLTKQEISIEEIDKVRTAGVRFGGVLGGVDKGDSQITCWLIKGCCLRRAALVRGLMSNAEWAFFEPFVVEKGPRRGRRPRDHRLVLDGVFWIARTGTAWRDLQSHFGPWNSVYRQFRRWTQAGLWDMMLEALNKTGTGHDSVQMIDPTIIRAHQHAAGALNNGIRTKVLGALAVASRPRSISAAMLEASLSPLR